MKKNGKNECARPATPAAAAEQREEGDSSRNRKTYLNRLEDMGLTTPPVAAKVKAPRHAVLAQLAATLSKDSPGTSAGELVGRAMEIWNASASAMFIEDLAGFVVRGVCYFDEADWETHCRSLVALFDDAKGAVPGQNSSNYSRESIIQAQVKAGTAVTVIWKRVNREQRGVEVIRALFPAKSETAESRSKKLLSLLEFASAKVGGCDEARLLAEEGNPLRACLRQAWEPLAIPPEDVNIAEVAARIWLDLPRGVEISNLGALPVLARWLTVLRMEQVAEAKSRV